MPPEAAVEEQDTGQVVVDEVAPNTPVRTASEGNVFRKLSRLTGGWLRKTGLLTYDTSAHMSHERPLEKEGDWEGQDPSELNWLQRRAQKAAKWSKGWLTAANVVRVVSAGAVAKGLVDATHGEAVKGVVEIGLGRIGDLVDGVVAAWTKTRGKIGALIDSGLDKLLSAFGLYELTAVTHDIPLGMAVPIILEQSTIIALNKVIHNRGGAPTPNKAGKWGMAALWGYFGAPIAYRAMEALHWSGQEVTQGVGTLSGIGALVLGAVASYDYYKQADSSKINLLSSFQRM